MNIAVLSFTKCGEFIEDKLLKINGYNVDLYTRENYRNNLDKIYSEYEGIIFISSTGIAVRISAPYIRKKTVDPAIVVVDDLGRYSISLLSGHIGGANKLAAEIAEFLNCQAIITTASDSRGIEAVDLFAQRNNLHMENMESVKKITAMMVEGKRIKLFSDIKINICYKNIVFKNEDGAIFITSEMNIDYDKPYCVLRPKNLNVGIGCRRGKTKNEILDAVKFVFKGNNLSLNSIKYFATVDVKKDEKGIIEACNKINCQFKIFDREEIKKVQDMFDKSEFVKANIGVSSVCEPCAYLAGGEIIVGKTSLNGITVAVSKEEY